MIINNEDAKMQWCPFVRVAQDDEGGAVNRTHSGGFTSRSTCLAERCMMWNWHDREEDTGYCGLATKGRLA